MRLIAFATCKAIIWDVIMTDLLTKIHFWKEDCSSLNAILILSKNVIGLRTNCGGCFVFKWRLSLPGFTLSFDKTHLQMMYYCPNNKSKFQITWIIMAYKFSFLLQRICLEFFISVSCTWSRKKVGYGFSFIILY